MAILLTTQHNSRMTIKSQFPLQNYVDLLLDAICVVDIDGRFLFVSAACERIFGYTQEEMVGKTTFQLMHPDDVEKTRQLVKEIMAGEDKPFNENRYIHKQGHVVHIMWSARWAQEDQVRIGVARDITKQKQAEMAQNALYAISEAAHSAEDLVALFRQIHQTVATLLPARNFFVALYDKHKDELSFPYCIDEFEEAPATQKLNAGTLSGEVISSGEALLLTPETRKVLPKWPRQSVGREALDWLGVPLISTKGTIGAIVVQSYSGSVRYTERDKELLQFVSTQIAAAVERKQMQTRLQYAAEHDQLTGLPNRMLFHDRLKTALTKARRSSSRLAVLFLDLNRFKEVNDNFGHHAGDVLLQCIAVRLREAVRESDTVGRLGGDEFVILLGDVERDEHAVYVVEKIRTALEPPFNIEGNSIRIYPSIGVAIYPDNGGDETQLLKFADDAMYKAKRGR